MPLPLTVSCSIKIQIGFTFLVPAHPGNPGQRAVKRVCVCVCVCTMLAGLEARHLAAIFSVLYQLIADQLTEIFPFNWEHP